MSINFDSLNDVDLLLILSRPTPDDRSIATEKWAMDHRADLLYRAYLARWLVCGESRTAQEF